MTHPFRWLRPVKRFGKGEISATGLSDFHNCLLRPTPQIPRVVVRGGKGERLAVCCLTPGFWRFAARSRAGGLLSAACRGGSVACGAVQAPAKLQGVLLSRRTLNDLLPHSKSLHPLSLPWGKGAGRELHPGAGEGPIIAAVHCVCGGSRLGQGDLSKGRVRARRSHPTCPPASTSLTSANAGMGAKTPPRRMSLGPSQAHVWDRGCGALPPLSRPSPLSHLATSLCVHLCLW